MLTLEEPEVRKIDADFPEPLRFLFAHHRYKVARGGRGSGKSWGFARALLLIGTGTLATWEGPKRILCARETQKSIADSVHKLLGDQVETMGLGGVYEVGQSFIRGRNGTEFLFAGLRHNVANIKSLESCDIVWVEEGQGVSKDSWDTLIPTIRKAGSEIWVSYNPVLETDDTHKRFALNPPPNAKVVEVNWTDNPWFPEELRIEANYLRETNPAEYDHIYGGKCRSSVDGAIYGAEMGAAIAQGRITSVPYDRTRPVDTFWDLGFGDTNAIWFAQSLPNGTYRVIDYLENRGQRLEWYLIQMQQRGYLYGIDWLPHDGVDAIIHTKLAGDKSRSIEMLMRAAGRNVRIAPKLHVASGINAVRSILPNCWFDEKKCTDGLQGLRHYQWGPISSSGVERREPLHNWASHPADAFRTLALCIQQPRVTPQPAKPRQHVPITTWS